MPSSTPTGSAGRFGEPKRFVEHLDVAVLIDSPDHPDLPAIEWQRVGHTEGHEQRAPRAVPSCGVPLMDQSACEIRVGGHLKGMRPGPQLPQGAEAISVPDFFLSEAVVAFDPGVGSGLPLGRKDWDDSTGQTESDQLSQTAGMKPAARQAHVVVHLEEPRPACARLEKVDAFTL
ncbi:MAG: hypothetical protein OJF50_001265 [Nitrospira sp.]|nr:hypothetical protein [Nitrospira sp.]